MTDHGQSVSTIAHPKLCSGELKMTINGHFSAYNIYIFFQIQCSRSPTLKCIYLKQSYKEGPAYFRCIFRGLSARLA